MNLSLIITPDELETLKELAAEWAKPEDAEAISVEAFHCFRLVLREEARRRAKLRPSPQQTALALGGSN